MLNHFTILQHGIIHGEACTTHQICFLHFIFLISTSIYDMELRLKTPTKYLFSSFETVHWYAAAGLIDELKSKLLLFPGYKTSLAKLNEK